ncbi:MAG: sugar phosphate nucleotidyltransferase [Bacteroidota bacterium]
MKAIIPVAGAGTQLRPLTYTQPKPLIPVAGKPIVSYIIDQMTAIGVTDFVFVLGYLGEKIKDYINQTHPEIQKTFVYQHERKGLGHAIWMAREAFHKEEAVFIILGDTIIDLDFQAMLEEPLSCFGVKKVQDPRHFGVAEYDQQTRLVRKVVEKPKIPMTNMAMVGIYKISKISELIDALTHHIENNHRTHGEFQLTDALMHMINRGISFKALPVASWFDCGKKEILLDTNATLLRQKARKEERNPEGFQNSIFIHPVHIGKNCQISNSIIGPYVTIGDNSKIEYSIVRNSIVGNYASISGVILDKSILGNDTLIKGPAQSLNIGDNTEIDFS